MRLGSRIAVAMIALIALGGCAPLVTQSPGEGLSPVNAVADGPDGHVMLFGYDVVNYFTEGRERKGSPQIRSEYKTPLPTATSRNSAGTAPTASRTASHGAETPTTSR
jgi:hypothetical protein